MKIPSVRTATTVAMVFVALVLGAYIVNFAIVRRSPISPETAEWAQFGDYIGGLLNPLFGFLAFMGVLVTLHLQTTQLQIARRQSELEELQRLISSISKDADSILSRKPRLLGDPPVENDQITLWQILSAVGTAVLNDDARTTELKSKMLDIISLPTQTLLVELHQLVWSLDAYKTAGGSSTVVDFYKKRYEVVVCWIHASGLLNGNPRVKEYFDPEKLAPSLRVR